MNYDNFVTKEQILALVRSQPRKLLFREGLGLEGKSGKEYYLETKCIKGSSNPYCLPVEATSRNVRISLLELLTKAENLTIEHKVEEDTEKQIVFQGYSFYDMVSVNSPKPNLPFVLD